MMYDLYLTWRNLRTKPIQTLIPTVIISLAIALSTAVLALGSGVRQGIIEASDPFGVLVVGPKGSSQQLVLNSVLLQDNPVGIIPYDIYERLENDERVRFAVPLAIADNVSGAQIIGTNDNFFELRRFSAAPPAYQIAEGRKFEAPFEAVLGSQAAASLGLGIGDQFVAAHGTGPALEADLHVDPYTVVGIMAHSNTPYDSAVFTSLDSVWQAHGIDTSAADDSPGEDDILPPEAASNNLITAEQDFAGTNLTSILVAPTGFAEAGQIWTEFYAGTEAQAAYPGRELGALFDLLSQAETVL
ncbi:MAG: ABC transporter permease, partial [Chloroflexota bacterium]